MRRKKQEAGWFWAASHRSRTATQTGSQPIARRALVGSFKAGVARTVYALMVADRTNWSAVTAQRPLGTKRAGTSLPPYHAMDGSLSFLTHNPTSCLLFES